MRCGFDVPSDASITERFAASEMRRYLEAMLEVRVTPDADVDSIATRREGDEWWDRFDHGITGSGPDSFIVLSEPDRLVLRGGGDRGTLYSVYDVLGREGVGGFCQDPDGEVVPTIANLSITAGERIEEPAFHHREISSPGGPGMTTARSLTGRSNRLNRDFSDLPEGSRMGEARRISSVALDRPQLLVHFRSGGTFRGKSRMVCALQKSTSQTRKRFAPMSARPIPKSSILRKFRHRMTLRSPRGHRIPTVSTGWAHPLVRVPGMPETRRPKFHRGSGRVDESAAHDVHQFDCAKSGSKFSRSKNPASCISELRRSGWGHEDEPNVDRAAGKLRAFGKPMTDPANKRQRERFEEWSRISIRERHSRDLGLHAVAGR